MVRDENVVFSGNSFYTLMIKSQKPIIYPSSQSIPILAAHRHHLKSSRQISADAARFLVPIPVLAAHRHRLKPNRQILADAARFLVAIPA